MVATRGNDESIPHFAQYFVGLYVGQSKANDSVRSSISPADKDSHATDYKPLRSTSAADLRIDAYGRPMPCEEHVAALFYILHDCDHHQPNDQLPYFLTV